MTYKQSTGELSDSTDVLMGIGYAGNGPGLNNPDYQNVHNVGPLPQGFYTIGAPTTEKGPLTMPLTPDPGNRMYGRAGFLIHGDNHLMNHTASEGCIVLPNDVRQGISNGDDKWLEVVA
jgi:hypothetical protein